MATRKLHVVYENQHLKQSTKQQKKTEKSLQKIPTHTQAKQKQANIVIAMNMWLLLSFSHVYMSLCILNASRYFNISMRFQVQMFHICV